MATGCAAERKHGCINCPHFAGGTPSPAAHQTPLPFPAFSYGPINVCCLSATSLKYAVSTLRSSSYQSLHMEQHRESRYLIHKQQRKRVLTQCTAELRWGSVHS